MRRFDYEECYLKFDGEVFAIAENKKNAKVIGETLIQLSDENEQLKQRIKSRLHYYRELCNSFDEDDGFTYDIVKRVVEDLEYILK